MYQNEATGQNTLHVNDTMARIYKLLLVAVAAAVIARAAGLITLPWPQFIAVSCGIGAASLLPIACRHFRMEGNKLKYINIYCASGIFTFGYIYLQKGMIVLLAVPLGLACLYFDLRLIGHASALAALGLLLGEALSGGAGWSLAVPEQPDIVKITMNIMQLGIVILLMTAIAKRALKMVSDTHSFYENINDIFSNANASAQNLEAAEGILLQGVNYLGAAEEKPEEEPQASGAAVRNIISNINKTMENAKEIMKYTQTMLRGKGKELTAADEMAKLEEYARSSKELIAKLAKNTDKVKENLSLISVMVDETKMISVNAAAAAENASSGGKGSVIIAMKVEKLADESVGAATHIQELLNSVVNDAENTVEAVAKAYEEVFKSLELINRTVDTLIKWLMYKNMK